MTYGTAAVLLALGIVLMVAPEVIPELDDPQRRRPTDGMNYADEMRMP